MWPRGGGLLLTGRAGRALRLALAGGIDDDDGVQLPNDESGNQITVPPRSSPHLFCLGSQGESSIHFLIYLKILWLFLAVLAAILPTQSVHLSVHLSACVLVCLLVCVQVG